MIGFDNHSTNASVFRADSETEAYENEIQDMCKEIVADPEDLYELFGELDETSRIMVFSLLAEIIDSSRESLSPTKWELCGILEKSARKMAIRRLNEETSQA